MLINWTTRDRRLRATEVLHSSHQDSEMSGLGSGQNPELFLGGPHGAVSK